MPRAPSLPRLRPKKAGPDQRVPGDAARDLRKAAIDVAVVFIAFQAEL
jgi:hypothetical protein